MSAQKFRSRLLSLPDDHSFFLFGPRGVGKSTLIKKFFDHRSSLFLDLLVTSVEDRFQRNPGELKDIVQALPEEKKYVVIDEIQKVPALLDLVHLLIESTDKIFILTGSSARKLKAGGANLLAGRAFVYHLHPLSVLELEEGFQLDACLEWGMLPKVIDYQNDLYRKKYLQTYAHTYLKEEVWEEQYVRDLAPFRKFLEVAAQMNGKIINYANIAADVGVDPKTIEKYYSILEDTMLGFFLTGFQHSFRKRLSSKPKFYFFDTGVTRALSRRMAIPYSIRTTAYGDAFEHFVLLECLKLSSYFHEEFRFSYLRTKDDVEVDLIVDRPGLAPLFIEVKSSSQVSKNSLLSFWHITKDFPDCEAVCFSNDPYEKKWDHVHSIPWYEGLKRYFS